MGRKLTVLWDERELGNSVNAFYLLLLLLLLSFPMCPTDSMPNWTSCFGVYNEIDDQGQRTISAKWVVSERELSDGLKCVEARLVIRGFEEDEKGPVGSPTSSMKIF